MSTYEQLLTLLVSVAPNATVSRDEDGQVIIHTNLTEVENSILEEMEA
jgi:hypothetical protein